MLVKGTFLPRGLLLGVPGALGKNIPLTNMTGHPCVVLPNGFTENGTPSTVTFVGKLYAEAEILALAKRYQDATDFHLKHPELEV